ncbi:MAG: crossover junction endodeoxyribonuclease RuvC [Halorhodospira halophila]|uniref:crossover junction endodeoxyribonuclease RuvC n=1 Tax=Halorhodospira TaxID=85108 RepID=UPI0019139F08|nr:MULTISPECIES: crossover junction endodeoxyribonuclease RuvC [Halorhodospira]MBK5937675.1 crossover junction endodeoxyribonuclease RuvC [Halorhodospira halophila]MBK5944519.1 crossover junction endodeoxyribonuclease RuvC [Halorhodospira halophila]MCC3750773.1 crossover junction endodeoxyribonuclease RuvC [Halorhodospira halophila]MCG5527358.1 crossover junction endodeoxyribonuclease RuvC [Halorhodospira halophila]MCG5532922.1 crossover junction endodeoxyribonuclease RuvC [Halorhodospira sp. 
MTRILGIDPGSRVTGYGIVDDGRPCRLVAEGTLRLPRQSGLAERLGRIFDGLAGLIAEHHPDEVALEQVFVHRNADTALKLGHARGAALTACVHAGLPVAEYAPARIKQAVAGSGRADKGQVGYMVRALLRLRTNPAEDAADALAAALCHAHHRSAPLAQAASGAPR